MIHRYDLQLGLPHTNARGLAEPLLMQQAGHFQWSAIASAVGVPLSKLRTLHGGEVYATFYYIEEIFPASAPLESFRLDDPVRFLVSLRAFKNLAIEGRIVFDRPEQLSDAERDGALAPDAGKAHPWIHFGNIFITPLKGNSVLRVAPPANADFSGLPQLPNAENPYHLTKAAAERGSFGLLDGWTAAGAPSTHRYAIDPDRDTNGAGLVYFANYVAFMETAERVAMADWRPQPAGGDRLARRSLRHRRIGYYGNVDVDDAIVTDVTAFTHPDRPDHLGLHYAVRRETDQAIICRSEAIKALPAA